MNKVSLLRHVAAFMVLVVLGLSGCASSSSSILVGKARAPVSPDDVKLYLRAPAKYEEIAMIESSSKASMAVSDQAKTDVSIQRLKEEAAKVGANGVLLTETGSEVIGGVMAGSSFSTGVGSTYATPMPSRAGAPSSFGGSSVGTNFGTMIGVQHKTGKGLAVFVVEE
jgi:hypothetical protein